MPRRVMEGKVVSTKCDKTVTVQVNRNFDDPKYSKVVRRSKKFTAHDEANKCQVGDVVQIEECRPISKTKTWKVVEKDGK